MGKGQRSRLARADEMKAKKEAAVKKAKRDKRVKIISIIAAVVVALGTIGGITYSALKSSGYFLRKDIAVQSANYKVNNAGMLYVFSNYYSTFVNQNSSYLSSLGLDTSKSLVDQTCAIATKEDGSAMTWYEYLMDGATQQLQQTLVLAEDAKANDFVLTEEDNKTIESTMANIDVDQYGIDGLKESDVRQILELSLLASNYEAKLEGDVDVSEEKLVGYYEEHKTDFDVADFYAYSFNYETEEEVEEESTEAVEETEEETETETEIKTYTKEEAKKLADELAETGDKDAYIDWLKKYMTEVVGVGENQLDSEIAAYNNEAFAYSTEYVGYEFIFDTATKSGDIKVVEDTDEGSYKVILVTKPAYRDDSATKSVRHILMEVAEDADDDTKAAVKQQAEDLLNQWKEGEATEDSFADLVHDNTADTGSKETGGLYENFPRGQMVEAFEDWAYDESRKTGDTDIVETSYGYHIMYFVGDGTPEWRSTAESSLITEGVDAKIEALAQKYTAAAHDDNIAKLKSYAANFVFVDQTTTE